MVNCSSSPNSRLVLVTFPSEAPVPQPAAAEDEVETLLGDRLRKSAIPER